MYCIQLNLLFKNYMKKYIDINFINSIFLFFHVLPGILYLSSIYSLLTDDEIAEFKAGDKPLLVNTDKFERPERVFTFIGDLYLLLRTILLLLKIVFVRFCKYFSILDLMLYKI